MKPQDINEIHRQHGIYAVRHLHDQGIAVNGNGYDHDEGTRPRTSVKQPLRQARETQPPPPENAAPDGFTADSLEIARPVPQLIKGILPQRGTVLLNGQSQAGKTFIATDMAVAVASGQDFFGKPVKRRGGVVIIAAEGMGGLQNRLIAAKVSRGLPKALPILWPHTIGNLLNERDLQAVLDKLTQAHLYFQQKFGVPLVLTIIDTITKACGMKDENANAEIVKVCKEVLDKSTPTRRRLPQPCITWAKIKGPVRAAGLHGPETLITCSPPLPIASQTQANAAIEALLSQRTVTALKAPLAASN